MSASTDHGNDIGLGTIGVGNDIFSHTGYNQPDIGGIGGAIHTPELSHGAGLTPGYSQP